MASPFKTHETMDLARALLEEDSSYTNCSGKAGVNNNEDDEVTKPSTDGYPLDPLQFDNLVVTKESSTELIPSHLVEDSCVNLGNGKGISSTNKPDLMLVRDLNAGKGMLDDDGKPVVGKVFSRVIQISGVDSKPKQLKSHHRGRSSSSCCRDKQGQDKDRASSARPQSGQQQQQQQQQKQRHSGARAGKRCPSCNRQFSDETVMERHIVFCTGSSKDIM